MRDFDIDKVGTKMPYASVDRGFFEQFPMQVVAEIESRRRKKRVMLWRMSSAVAAVVAAVVTFTVLHQNSYNEYKDVENHIVQLSDEELSILIYEGDFVDEFYANL